MTREDAPHGTEDEPYARLASDLDALANAARLRLLHALVKPRYAEEIADALGMSRQGAAKHVQRLRERGFVRALHGRRETGPVTEYQVVPQRLFALTTGLGALAHLEVAGGPLVRKVDPTVKLSEDEWVESTEAPVAIAPAVLVLPPGASGERVVLDPDRAQWTVGRDDACDVTLAHDPFVSARHALVQRTRTGLDLVDLASANGTRLNLVEIPRNGRVPLRSGDVVTVGRTHLVVQPD